jgi:hypothetical protein
MARRGKMASVEDFLKVGGNVGGAAAGGLGGLPWNIILPIAISFFSSILGGGDDKQEKALEMQKILEELGMEKPYRSPNLAGLDRATLQAVLNQMNRSSNWGWPGGKQMDTSFITDLLGEVSNPPRKPRIPLLPTGTLGKSQLLRG